MQLGKVREVLLTSDQSGKNFSIGIWNVHCGSLVKTLKSEPTSPCTFLLRGNNILAVCSSKCYVSMISLNGDNRQPNRLHFDAPISTVALSSKCHFLAVAMNEKVQLWELNTGWESNALTGHYQTVSNLIFTKNDRYLISGGEDGLILVWDVYKILAEENYDMKPLFTLTFHTLPVTCLWSAPLSNWNFLLTSSLDQCCRVINLFDGMSQCRFEFPSSVYCVCASNNMVNVFCGLGNGKIYRVKRNDLTDFSCDTENDSGNVFKGHSLPVKCLHLSLDGTMLASGSDDQTVRLWDVRTRMSLHVLKHNGSIINLCFTIMSTDNSSDEVSNVVLAKRGSLPDGFAELRIPCAVNYSLASLKDFRGEDEVQNDVMELKCKIEKLIETNRELFEFAVIAKHRSPDQNE